MRLRFPPYQDAALLLIRLGLAAVLIVHGWLKWQNLDGTAEFFSSLALPQFMVYVVATTELVGGLLVLFGWLARFSSLGLAVVMVFAIVLVKWPIGFVGGYEFDLVLLLMALAVAVGGPGRYRLKVINLENQQLI